MHRPDMKDLERERVLSGHPIYARERGNVSNFIIALRAASAPGDYYALHQRLLRSFIGCQRWLEGLEAAKERIKEGIRDAKEEGDDGVVRALSREIKGNDLDQFAAKAVLGIYRGLADALVWHLLGFRRSAITFLGEGRRVGRLADQAGLLPELAEIDSLWRDDGIVAVHADITTCIQHGDVLSIQQWDPRVMELTEVKASRDAAPDSPQMERLERVTELINEGEHPSASDGKPLVVHQCPISLESHFSKLSEHIELAHADTYDSFSPEPGLLVEIYDETNPAQLDRDEVDQRHAEAEAELSEDPEHDLIHYSISARRLRDRKHSFSSLAPVALYPLAADQVADLVMGGVDVVTTLHATALEDELAASGITARIARGEAAGDSFMTAERGAARVTVPAPVREQVMLEQMTIETLTNVIDWMLEETRARGTDPPAAVLAFPNEAEYWTVGGDTVAAMH